MKHVDADLRKSSEDDSFLGSSDVYRIFREAT